MDHQPPACLMQFFFFPVTDQISSSCELRWTMGRTGTIGFCPAIYLKKRSQISRELPVSNRKMPYPTVSLQSPKPKFDLSVYLVTDRRTIAPWTVEQVVRSAIAGVDGKRTTFVQLRDKYISREQSLELGKALRQITSEAQVPFVINDDIDLALEIGADGVHVGQDDESCTKARAVLGSSAIIGVSAGNILDAEQAIQDGADYIGVGPVFKTFSKSNARKPIGPEGLGEIVNYVNGRIPVVAIGGITVENANECRAAGASGVAVISAIMQSSHPDQAAATLYERMRST